MSEFRKKGGVARNASKLSGSGTIASPGKQGDRGVRRLVVQFRPKGDHTAAQTEAVRSILRRFRGASVKREFPGAIKIEIAPDIETRLRRSLGKLKEWDVGLEGLASMPGEPSTEE